MFKRINTGDKIRRMTSIMMPDVFVKRVIIVDDEVFLLEYLREMLEEYRLEVYTASSPERAVKIADMLAQLRRKVHLVFMDFNMPGLNGADTVKLLKADRFKASLGQAQFTIMTAQNDALVKEKFREVGVTQFIFKPYSFEQIRDHLICHGLI